jgi:maltose/moltooligosaccharide transporter
MTSSAVPRPKPRLSFWDIWNMSFGFLGIQFGFALQNANVSRIFETLGAKVEDIPILWVAAPVTGLVVQPIVGYFSDRTWNRLGRRRPYFFGGAILASLALIAMPNSPVLWVAAGMLWIMDASINISMEPFRAFVGDNLPAAQRVTGFAMQSFFIGTGAVVASMLPWILTTWFGVSNEAPEHMIPQSVRLAFYLGAAVFFIAMLWTVLKSREYSPEEMASFEENQTREGFAKARRTAEEYAQNGRGQLLAGAILLAVGALATVLLAWQAIYQVMILSAGIAVVGVLLIVGGLLQRSGRYENGFVTILNDFQDMPRTMKQLAWAQFFSWFTAPERKPVTGAARPSARGSPCGSPWRAPCRPRSPAHTPRAARRDTASGGPPARGAPRPPRGAAPRR